jgi:hypothetical protein
MGDFGDDATIYYFGRTRQQRAYDMSLEGIAAGVHARQKKMLKHNCRRVGLNSPSRVLLWGRTTNVEKDWDGLKDFLKGHRFAVDNHPLITNQLWVGDNWFTCESHGPEALGMWVRAVWNLLHEDRLDERVIVGDEDEGEESGEEEEQPPVDDDDSDDGPLPPVPV